MKAIVGLGNPGPRYRYTRHNVGWHVLDVLAARWLNGRPPRPATARHAEVVRCVVEGETVLLVKPQTFMNDSGRAVRALVEKDGLAPVDILVIYDDLDLALGRIRVRAHGSAGGHRGIQSIQQHLAKVANSAKVASSKGQGAGEQNSAGGEETERPMGARTEPPSFPRIKIGLGRPPAGVDPIEFVLAGFLPDELPQIRPAIERAADAAECWLRDGTEATANRFNGM
ncbi:MAG: aminoacyl-tRNA hydrolase [Chloroflexota bacterium]